MRTVNKKQHEEHRLQILSAARKLFAAHGVMETSMARIAKGCRVTKATLYHYFKGKNAILTALFDHSLEAHELFVQAVKREGTLRETLLRIAEEYLRMLERPEALEMMKIFQSEGMKNVAACQQYNERIRDRMDVYMRLGVERGILPDVDRTFLKSVVFTFFGSLEHYFIHARILKCDFVGGGEKAYAAFLAEHFAQALEMTGPQGVLTAATTSKEKRT